MHVNEVLIFLSAESKEALIKAMHDNNQFHGKGFQYLPPVKDGANWVVWFKVNLFDYSNKELNRPKLAEKTTKTAKTTKKTTKRVK